jgi:hypothetical protein
MNHLCVHRGALIQAMLPGHKAAALPAAAGERYTDRQLNDRIDRIGLALTRRGFGRGASALILLKNRAEFLMIQPALGRIGSAAIPASWRSTVPEIAYLAEHVIMRIPRPRGGRCWMVIAGGGGPGPRFLAITYFWSGCRATPWGRC